MAEKSVDSLPNKLQKYQELSRKRAVLEDMLNKAEDEKESVKQGIYQRVCREYQTELDQVKTELDPLVAEVERSQTEWSEQLRETEAKAKEVQEGLEEHEFRYRVGEYKDTEYSKLETPLKKQLEEYFKTSSDLRSKLEQIEAAHQTLGDGTTHATQATAPRPEAAPAAESQPKPMKSHDVSPEEKPVLSGVSTGGATSLATDGEAQTKTPAQNTAPDSSKSTPDTESEFDPFYDPGTPPKTAGHTPASEPQEPTRTATQRRGDDVVDLTDWTKEFQREKKMDGGGSSKTPPKPPTPTPALSDDDRESLSGLADPTTSAADTAPPVRKETRRVKPAPTLDPSGGFPVLIIVKGPGAGKKLPLVPVTMTLGREHDNNIELKDEEVARYHARISFERGQYVLEDLESSSGTWVNDEKVNQAPLTHGDKIRVGTTEMIIDFE